MYDIVILLCNFCIELFFRTYLVNHIHDTHKNTHKSICLILITIGKCKIS
jgi:hypothetical protein